jgi:hypothetical protein
MFATKKQLIGYCQPEGCSRRRWIPASSAILYHAFYLKPPFQKRKIKSKYLP